MYQTGIIVLIASVVLSLCLVLLLHAVFAKKVKKRNQMEMEAHRQLLTEENALMLETYRAELNQMLERELSTYKTVLNEQHSGELIAFKKELKATADFEVALIKSKIKNNQPSYPKRLEAQQKLAVLSDNVTNLFTSLDFSAVSYNSAFTKTEEAIEAFLLEYSGIIDEQTEEILRHCTLRSSKNKNKMVEKDTSGKEVQEQAEMLVQELTNAKRILKSSTVQTKSI